MERPIATPVAPPADSGAPAWERDGFAFIGDRLIAASGPNLWCWGQLDRPPTRLWAAGEAIDHVAARPGRCDRVSVVVGGDLWTVTSGGAARRLGEACLVPGTRAVWSPAGDRIAVAQGESGFGIAHVDGGAVRTIAGASDADPLVWDADGILLVEHHPLGKFREWYWLWSGGKPRDIELPGPYYTSPDGGLRVLMSGSLATVTVRGRERRMRLPRGTTLLGLAERTCWVGRRWLAHYDAPVLIDFERAACAKLRDDVVSFAAATADGQRLVVVSGGELVAIDIDERQLVWEALEDPDVRRELPPTPRRKAGWIPRAVARLVPGERRPPVYSRCSRCDEPCGETASPPLCKACRARG